MAGDIETPFNIDFQADSVFSGSISFGRYENESLSWERRSSFSHNRYLEEVEKYSKPGSVNEKKAYFEAHFKKKGGFLGQISPESNYGLVYSTIENSVSEKVDEGADLEIINKENDNGRFEDSSDGPENHGDHEGTEYEMTNLGVSFTDPKSGPSFSTAGCSMDSPKDVNSGEKEDADSGANKLHTFVEDGLEIEREQNISDIASSENTSSEAMDSSPKTELVKRVGKSSSGSQQTLSVKMTLKRDTKASKSQVNIHHTRRNNSGAVSKSPDKVANKSKRDPSQIKCTEEHSSKTATLFTRTPKIEDFKPIKGKAIIESRRSEKGKTSGDSYSSSLKLESRLYPKTISHNRTVNSAMQDAGESSSGSKFRSIGLAERRKQGKAEAEVKILQKNLDIKLKSIPSSYGAIRPESDGKKAVLSSTKVRNTFRKSTAGGLSSHLPFGKDTNSCASVPLDTSKNVRSCQATVRVEASTNSSTSSANQEVLSKVISEPGNVPKKDHLKEKDSNLQKSRASEYCRVSKGQEIEGRQRFGARRSMNLTERKVIKGVAGSRMGPPAVGVSS